MASIIQNFEKRSDNTKSENTSLTLEELYKKYGIKIDFLKRLKDREELLDWLIVFEDEGFTEEQIKKIAKNFLIYKLNKDSISEKLKALKALPEISEDLAEICSSNSHIIIVKIKTIVENLNFLKNYGFENEEVKNIAKKASKFLSYNSTKLNEVKKLLSSLKNFGFKEEDIKSMIFKRPMMLYYISADEVLEKLKNLENNEVQKLTREEIIKMAIESPAILKPQKIPKNS